MDTTRVKESALTVCPREETENNGKADNTCCITTSKQNPLEHGGDEDTG